MDSLANIYNVYSENVTAISKTQNICYLPPTGWRNDEICGNTVVPQVLVSGSAMACLNFIFSTQVVQCRLCDVNTPDNIGVIS